MKKLILVITLLMTYGIINAQDVSAFNKNKVVAHRGAWKTDSLPQNSIASLKKAIELGCAGSEFDVHLTADNVLVLCHDNDHMGLAIEKTTYDELVKHQLPNGEKLPTLKEYLTEGMKQNKTKLFLEIKSSSTVDRTVCTAEKIVRLVKEMGADDWIFYIAFNYSAAKRIAELAPNAKVAYLDGDAPPQQLKGDNILGLDYHYSVLKKNSEWIEEAKRLGININVWTVNKPEDMDWFLQQDVDYITTDEPEILLTKSVSKI